MNTDDDNKGMDDEEDNKTFYLCAKVLEPDNWLILIDTELTMEVLPSEEVEYFEKI